MKMKSLTQLTIVFLATLGIAHSQPLAFEPLADNLMISEEFSVVPLTGRYSRSVASDGDKFFLIWSGFPDAGGKCFGRLLDATGRPVDDQFITLSKTPRFQAPYPGVVWNGKYYIVHMYESNLNGNSLRFVVKWISREGIQLLSWPGSLGGQESCIQWEKHPSRMGRTL